MRDKEVQKLMNAADGLREMGKHRKAIQYYLHAMREARRDWDEGVKDELWQRKVICIACNGMGISYSKWGKQMEALENFQDAIAYAPAEEARRIAGNNLAKLQQALKEKTGIEFVSHLFDEQ